MLVFIYVGRQRQWLRLLPLTVLESGDLKNQAIKVPDTEGMYVRVSLCVLRLCSCSELNFLFSGASRFTYNSLGRNVYLCVAVKTRVIIYEISNSQKNKCEKKKVRSTHT